MQSNIPKTSSYGYCVSCRKEHSIYSGAAYTHALELIKKLDKYKRLDFEISEVDANSIFNIDYLFGEAEGQMFGILECENNAGEKIILKAFSGKYNGQWLLDGWVPPLFDVDIYLRMMKEGDSIITPLGESMVGMELNDPKRLAIHRKRKKLSQDLMKDLHALYRLHNFKGETWSLYDAFYLNKGIPTGTGDCCAPKLLNYAASNDLKPLSIAEFFYGRANSAGTRFHKEFYSSCEGKCQPILGFMLCGLNM